MNKKGNKKSHFPPLCRHEKISNRAVPAENRHGANLDCSFWRVSIAASSNRTKYKSKQFHIFLYKISLKQLFNKIFVICSIVYTYVCVFNYVLFFGNIIFLTGRLQILPYKSPDGV